MNVSGPVPRYQKVKDYVRQHIEAGRWNAGDLVPSENDLVKELGVSRMTVNRAFRELTQDGILVRIQGAGTYVAEKKPPAEFLQIRNIADEIKDKGLVHSAKPIVVEQCVASDHVAALMDIMPGTAVFYSMLVHFAGDAAVQLEERYVDRHAAPGYLDEDFSQITPNEHLMKAAQVTEVEHIVEAIGASDTVAGHLGIAPHDPCLRLRRRTWDGDRVVTLAYLYHPGHSYRFGARFSIDG